MALYGFGVASLLAAVVTFIAHNWTYLGTELKLGGLGVALILCAGMWVLKGFDGRSAQSFGIAAQVLIGVWLAAAGQIYQAPGGLQDLLIIWAGLGLPFALASRSPAHWAVWFGVIGLAALSPMGQMLSGSIGLDWKPFVLLFGGLILAVGLIGSLYKRAPIWLSTLFAVVLCVLWVFASWVGLGDFNPLGRYGPSLIALTLLLALCRYVYASRVMSTTAVLVSAVPVIVVSVLAHLLSKFVDDGILFFLIMTGLVCGATYALVLVFKHLRTLSPNTGVSASDDRSAHENPWYMDALIGVGGVVTANFAIGLIAMTIALTGVLERNWGVSLCVIGAGVYGLSVFVRRHQSGQFLRFLFGTIILVGMACLSVGIAEVMDSLLIGGLLLLALSVVTSLIISDDRILSSLMAVSACVAIAVIASDSVPTMQAVAVLLPIYACVGLVFGTIVMRGKIHTGIAGVFLLAAVLTGIVTSNDMFGAVPLSWTAVTAVNACVAVCGGLWLWFVYTRESGPSWPVLITLSLIALVLPIGAVPAMLLLILAYTIGSRALFLIGVLATIWFLFSAYFDLTVTLMMLSGIMAAVGAGLLGLWAFASKRVEIAS